MASPIDDAFIAEWEPQYPANDEDDYKLLVADVSREIRTASSIVQSTFERIVKWKTRNRSRRFLELDLYAALYEPAFRRSREVGMEAKIAELLAPEKKLPGMGAPLASTVLHFMYPDCMPIIDVRTAAVLFHFKHVKTRQSNFNAYEPFRLAIARILIACPRSKLRQLDRALFAYHKRYLSGTRLRCG